MLICKGGPSGLGGVACQYLKRMIPADKKMGLMNKAPFSITFMIIFNYENKQSGVCIRYNILYNLPHYCIYNIGRES